MHKTKKIVKTQNWLKSGFTIVELIVVIAVIGILASIVIVSYGSWKTTTIANQLKSDLNGVATAMENARTFGNTYPATVPSTFVPSSGVTLGGGNLNSGASYCVSATNGSQSYFISAQYPTPLVGTCPVIYLDASIKTSYPGTGTTWTDLSGNGNNGTLNGGVAYNSANGGYLNFDGVDDNATFSAVFGAPTGNSDRTLSVWINTSGNGTTDMYPAVWLGSSGYHNITAIGVRAATHYLAMTFWGDELDSSVVATNGQWFNLVGTYVGATRAAKLYINGTFAAGKTLGANLTTSANIYLSSSPDSRRIKAALNNPSIYSRALSADEIQQNFNALRSRYGL